MGFVKKQSAGFYLTVLAAVLGAAGVIAYVINCGTDYFAKLGMNTGIIVCLAAAVILEVLYIALNQKTNMAVWADICPVIAGVLLMAGSVLLIGSRANSIASILTFEKNAQTMADLVSAIVGMACCLLAAIVTIISSFFNVVKEQ